MSITSDCNVVYTISVTVTRPIGSWQGDDSQQELLEAADWMRSDDAKRQLVREVLNALRKLDGDCDCEVMETAIQDQDGMERTK